MLGYAGLNRTLRERDPPVRCNRDMQKATFEERGLKYAGKLAERNFADLRTVLSWNHDHGIDLYRPPSALVPWHSQFDIADLPNDEAVREHASAAGAYVRDHGMRVSFHPSYFVKLASENADTVDRARTDLENHGVWLDLMGLPRSRQCPINVHVGGHYDDKKATADRFLDRVATLSPAVRDRLVVENDDEASLFSVAELVESVADPGDLAVTFDYHHHTFADGGMTYREAFAAAATTWDVRPVTHYSEPARLHGDPSSTPQTHADSVARVPDFLEDGADVVIECHDKEGAVLDVQTER
jgi:UV DNA damage endonuclease